MTIDELIELASEAREDLGVISLLAADQAPFDRGFDALLPFIFAAQREAPEGFARRIQLLFQLIE